MPRIANETEIKERAGSAILEIVRTLTGEQGKKKGQSVFFTSPWNTGEKTPSMSVHEGKKLFNDFSSGRKGGAMRFIMEHEGIEYREALEWAADFLNINLEMEGGAGAEKAKARQSLLKLAKAVAKYYWTENDWHETVETVPAIYRDTFKSFQLSPSQGGWNGLVNKAREKEWSFEDLLRLGLIKIKKDGRGYYDFFRNRDMFPLLDHSGRTVGFAGRATAKDEKIKYLNSPESELYSKSKFLYGLWQNKNMIREQNRVFIVEGYWDAISLHLIGVPAVATCGTALTSQQLELLKKYTKRIFVLFDQDKAGEHARSRVFPLALKLDFDVYDARLNEELITDLKRDLNTTKVDPDSFVQYYLYTISKTVCRQVQGDAALSETVKEVRKLFDEGIEHVSAFEIIIETETDGKKPDAAQIDKLCGIIHSIPRGSTRRAVALGTLAKKTNVNLSILREKLGHLDREAMDPVNKRDFTKKQLTDLEAFGFFEERNKYFFRDEKSNSFQAVSNCVLRPVMYIDDTENPSRLVEVINHLGQKRLADLPQQAWISKTEFKFWLERGNFHFYGGNGEFERIKMKVYNEMPFARPIRVLGWQKEGFYAFSNGVYVGGKYVPVDDDGLVEVAGANYFIPFYSRMYRHDPLLFESEKKFKYNDSQVGFQQWANQFIKVYDQKGAISICFYIAAIFRDLIVRKKEFFPHLNMVGEPGTGKSALCYSIASMFGKKQKHFNLHSGTNVALQRWSARFKNAVVHGDEYKNSVHPKRIEALKGWYDGAGHQRGNKTMDYSTNEVPINSALLLSGQELPNADNALFTRCITLLFDKTEYTEDEVTEFERLKAIQKAIPSNITADIASYYDVISTTLDEKFEEVESELRKQLIDDDIYERLVQNMTCILTPIRILWEELKIDDIMPWGALLYGCARQIERQNAMIGDSSETGIFWSIVESLLTNHQLTYGEHLSVDMRDTVKVYAGKDGKRRKYVEKPCQGRTLFLKFNAIHSLYMKEIRQQGGEGIPKDTLRHYFSSSKYYIGRVKSYRFASGVTSAEAFDYEQVKHFAELERVEDDANYFTQGAGA